MKVIGEMKKNTNSKENRDLEIMLKYIIPTALQDMPNNKWITQTIFNITVRRR